MEVRQLQTSRPGDEASLRLDAGGSEDARESSLGQEACLDRPLSDLADLGSEFDLDRAVLGVAPIGAELPR